MKKIIGIWLMACIALSANAQLLWKVSGNGLEKPSYVFGTHHLAPISVLDNIKGFHPALNEAEQVAVELTTEEMMSQESMMLMHKASMIENDTTLHDLMTEDEFNMVNKFCKVNLMIDLTMIPKLKPAYISNNATVIIYLKHLDGQFNLQEQLDMYVQQKAKEQDKKVLAFETMQFQVDLLFNETPLKRQAELLVCMLSDQDQVFKDAKELTDAYLKQDVKALYAVAEKRTGTHCDPLPGEMDAMIDNRNMRWMEALPGMMNNASTFVAVGALHLLGEKGLLNLLKEKGYTVEPVA